MPTCTGSALLMAGIHESGNPTAFSPQSQQGLRPAFSPSCWQKHGQGAGPAGAGGTQLVTTARGRCARKDEMKDTSVHPKKVTALRQVSALGVGAGLCSSGPTAPKRDYPPAGQRSRSSVPGCETRGPRSCGARSLSRCTLNGDAERPGGREAFWGAHCRLSLTPCFVTWGLPARPGAPPSPAGRGAAGGGCPGRRRRRAGTKTAPPPGAARRGGCRRGGDRRAREERRGGERSYAKPGVPLRRGGQAGGGSSPAPEAAGGISARGAAPQPPGQ